MGKRGRPPKKAPVENLSPISAVVESRLSASTCVSLRKRTSTSLISDGNKRKPIVTDLTSPPSVNLLNLIGNDNIKSLLTVENFEKLPLVCRRHLLKLLPKCDRSSDDVGKPRLASNALNNEYFTHACLEFKDRIVHGQLTPEGHSRDKLTKSILDRLDPWKVKHFEAYFGEKLKKVDFVEDPLLGLRRNSVRRNAAQAESVAKEAVKPNEPPALVKPKGKKGRPRKVIVDQPVPTAPIPAIVVEEKKILVEPLPKIVINFAEKTLTFVVRGKTEAVRQWVEPSPIGSPSTKEFDLPLTVFQKNHPIVEEAAKNEQESTSNDSAGIVEDVSDESFIVEHISVQSELTKQFDACRNIVMKDEPMLHLKSPSNLPGSSGTSSPLAPGTVLCRSGSTLTLYPPCKDFMANRLMKRKFIIRPVGLLDQRPLSAPTTPMDVDGSKLALFRSRSFTPPSGGNV